MKFTQTLFKHNISRRFRNLWQTQRSRPIIETRIAGDLSSMNIPVVDAMDIMNPKKEFPKLKITQLCQKVTFDETHPDWKARKCLTFDNSNVLQAAISQAYLLLKTVQINDKLPEKIENNITDIPEHIENLIKRIVCTSCIYDAQQVKLAKLKDPNRPSWVFPRVYGISNYRKMQNLARKFLQLCESLSGPSIAQNRSIVENGVTAVCIEKGSDLMQFTLKQELMLTSSSLITPMADQNIGKELDFPNIYPLRPTIGLQKKQIYKSEDVYPISAASPWVNVHTIFIHHDPDIVKNITELPVTKEQIHANSIVKSFIAAASCARQKFGSDVKHLPDPITVQCVQFDGKNFDFSVFQLNTLDIDGVDGVRNFWWSSPSLQLYEIAGYENGRPTLEGYNPEVFKRLFAFYKNT